MAGRKLSIGAVDIGGTKIATGLVNPSGRLIYRAQVETSRAGGEEAAEQVVSLSLQLVTEAKKRQLSVRPSDLYSWSGRAGLRPGLGSKYQRLERL